MFVGEILQLQAGERLLDVGCGTGDLLDHLPKDVDYTGFDCSARYLKSAIRRHGERSTSFVRADVNQPSPIKEGHFDVVTGVGLLHHLPDVAVVRFLEVAQGALKLHGRLATIDPCYRKDQPWLASKLMSHDRGEFVRSPQAYFRLVQSVFPSATLSVRTGLLRVPYSHAIVRAAKNG